jgi:acyl-CoA hydrolase
VPTQERIERDLTMTILMTPDMANFAGNVHGGLILKYLDQVAYTCASRFTRQYMVTASVDQVRFHSPVHIGDLVTLLASVNYTGRSSLEVGIRVETEDVTTGVRRHTNSCYFTMVALGEDGRPCEVRQVAPRTDEEHRRWSDALRRRAARESSQRPVESLV